jgi:2-dehydro-3-deoxyphosphooctonate aldolase (KDO 8-P synthase)
MSKIVNVANVKISNDAPFTLICGPCQIESPEHAFMMATEIKKITDKLGIPYIFKSSFDKANRSSLKGKRGIGLEGAVPVFKKIKDELGLPIVTDIHTEAQCEFWAKSGVVDMLQIPAFLCRQTDLVLAAGQTGLAINVKKGQFLAPWDVKNIVEKLESTGNTNILLTERGTTFGYGYLVVDMTSFPEMRKASGDYPVVIDATHGVQRPGSLGVSTGGNREYAYVLARASVAAGVGAVFLETHEDPDNAASDGPNSVRLDKLEEILTNLKAIDKVAKSIK